MKDRFKFRCWHEPTKTMYEVFDFNENFIRATPDLVVPSIRTLNAMDCVLIQCTGLKDKHGNLIFEGDIVRYIKKTETSIFTVKTEILFQIEWKNSKWKVKPIKIIKGSTGDVCGFDLHDIFRKDAYEQHQTEISIEVIGNIYENPELLSEVE